MIGVVLAGGKSRRMGVNKASLLWQGKTLLQHMSDLLLAAGVKRVVISGPEQIKDTMVDFGPLAGIATIVGREFGSDLLIVPVDMPLLSAESLRQLAAVPARYAHFDTSVLPCKLQADALVENSLDGLLANPEPKRRNIRQLMKTLKAQSIPASVADELVNINTPEQWQAIQQR